MIAHQRGVHTVADRRGTAALDVAQHGGAGVHTGRIAWIWLASSWAPTTPSDTMMMKCFLPVDLGLAHALQDVALKVVGDLRQQNGQRTGGDAHVQGDITGMMAHDLDDAAAVVALGGVAQFIDGFHRGVHGRVVADGVLAAGDVIVDGAGQTDAGDALVGQRPGAHEGTVAADDDQRIDAQFLAAGQTFGLSLPGS